MENENERIVSTIRKFVEDSFPYEIYDVTLKKLGKKKVLEVFIDNPQGVTVDDCEKVSRGLSDYLDEVDIIPDAFTLEVSSPGIERILKRQVDFERHVGKLVKWTLQSEGADGKVRKEVFEARLQEFTPDKIKVQFDKELRELPLSSVKEAQAVFEFPKELSANKRRRK
ncbi:MAG: ribosome maturation factor RimP [Candidatus Riflebacteria bacterium]|nr:ribosome maturation factor RimP [Candidatus Riflebacteria bacterium]